MYSVISKGPRDSEKYVIHAVPYTNSAQPVRTFHFPDPPKDYVGDPPRMNFNSLSFSADGKKAVMGPKVHSYTSNNMINVWDVEKGGLPFVIPHSFGNGSPEHFDHDPMAISRTGKHVAITTLTDRDVWIFSTETGNQHARCQVDKASGMITEIVASSAHDLFAVGSAGRVSLFDFDGKPIAHWDRQTKNEFGDGFSNFDIAFSPNGQYLAFASCKEKCIRVMPVPNPETMKNAE